MQILSSLKFRRINNQRICKILYITINFMSTQTWKIFSETNKHFLNGQTVDDLHCSFRVKRCLRMHQSLRFSHKRDSNATLNVACNISRRTWENRNVLFIIPSVFKENLLTSNIFFIFLWSVLDFGTIPNQHIIIYCECFESGVFAENISRFLGRLWILWILNRLLY